MALRAVRASRSKRYAINASFGEVVANVGKNRRCVLEFNTFYYTNPRTNAAAATETTRSTAPKNTATSARDCSGDLALLHVREQGIFRRRGSMRL
jgi:hypothetical protein